VLLHAKSPTMDFWNLRQSSSLLQAEAAWLGAHLGAEAGHRGMAQPRDADTSDANPRRRVLGHSQACKQCSKSKIKCDGERPCSRCLQREMADECEDQEGVVPHAQTPPVAGAQSSQAPVASNITDTSAGSKPRPKQLKHAQACVQCSRSKVRCDGGRPCGRCVQRGLWDVCRSRQAASDGRVALVGAGGEGEWTPHSVGETTPQSHGLEGLKLRGIGLGINGISSAGAAIPQQSAVVGLMSQGSATLTRDDSAAAGWGVDSGARAAAGGFRPFSLLLPQQHLDAGGNTGQTSALPLLRGATYQPLSQTLSGMDSGVLATPALPRIDSLLEPVLQPMRSPYGTTQAPLAWTPGSDRKLGLLSPGTSSSNLGLLSPGTSSSNLGLLSLGNSTSSLGSISDIFPNLPKVRSTADAPPTPGIPGLHSLGSSSSSLASFKSLFSVADSPPNLGFCNLGNSSSSLQSGGMGVVGANTVCARQQGGALPVPMHGRRFDLGSHSEPSQLRAWATLVDKSSLLGGAPPDQSRGAEQGSRRYVATSDLYSDSGEDDADASGAAASASDSGPLFAEVDVTFLVKRRCRLSFADPCRDVAVGRALMAAG